MNEQAVLLYSFLSGNTAVTDVVGSGELCRVYPAIAPIEVAKPFLIYSIGSDTVAKGARQYTALVSAYFDGESYTELTEFVEMLQGVFDGSDDYECGEIETGYSEKYNTMVAHINLNIY